jgi:hypothetical protein
MAGSLVASTKRVKPAQAAAPASIPKANTDPTPQRVLGDVKKRRNLPLDFSFCIVAIPSRDGV